MSAVTGEAKRPLAQRSDQKTVPVESQVWRAPLRGLSRVLVIVQPFDAGEAHLEVAIQKRLEERLRRAGLQILTMNDLPRAPILHLVATTKRVGKTSLLALDLDLLESVELSRAPGASFDASVWRDKWLASSDEPELAGLVNEGADALAEAFVVALLAANGQTKSE
jgi:hypothetical protein